MSPLPLEKPAGFTSFSLRSDSVVMVTTNGTRVVPPSELASGIGQWTRTLGGISGVSPDGRWVLAIPSKDDQGTWLLSTDGTTQRQVNKNRVAVSWAPNSQ